MPLALLLVASSRGIERSLCRSLSRIECRQVRVVQDTVLVRSRVADPKQAWPCALGIRVLRPWGS